jgi:phosphatidylglycerol:prolipoprotein diacylglycerol transferase
MSIKITIDPILVSIGPADVRWYGLMFTLGMAVIVVWTLIGAKKAGISKDIIYTSALWAIAFGLIISHLVYVLDDLDYFVDHPGDIFSLEGYTIYGGMLGGLLGIWIYNRLRGQPFGRLADALAPGMMLGLAVGRIGCTINGCCYGTKTTLPWGIIYTQKDSYATTGVEVHPTQIYELLFVLAIFVMLLVVRRKLKAEGSLILLCLATYSAGRFLLSFIRDNATYGGLREAQIISLLVLLITVPLLIYRIRGGKEQAASVIAEK